MSAVTEGIVASQAAGLCTLLGQPCERISAIFHVTAAVAALIAAGVAFYQLRRIRVDRARHHSDQKMWATLAACRDYDTDTLIDKCGDQVWKKTGGGKDYTKLDEDDRRAANIVLNFLDGIAIAVRQDMYDYRIVAAHFEHIIPKLVAVLLLGHKYEDCTPSKFCNEQKFPELVWIYGKMTKRKPPPRTFTEWAGSFRRRWLSRS